jgi:hypothetical protein
MSARGTTQEFAARHETVRAEAFGSRTRELDAYQDLLPPKMRKELASAAARLAPQPQAAPKEKWSRLTQASLRKASSLGFVAVHGTEELSEILTGSRTSAGRSGKLLRSWEARGLVRAYETSGHGRKPFLTGLEIPLVTEAALWLVDRRFSAYASSGDGGAPMTQSQALAIACAALSDGEYPPPIYRRHEARALLESQRRNVGTTATSS